MCIPLQPQELFCGSQADVIPSVQSQLKTQPFHLQDNLQIHTEDAIPIGSTYTGFHLQDSLLIVKGEKWWLYAYVSLGVSMLLLLSRATFVHKNGIDFPKWMEA